MHRVYCPGQVVLSIQHGCHPSDKHNALDEEENLFIFRVRKQNKKLLNRVEESVVEQWKKTGENDQLENKNYIIAGLVIDGIIETYGIIRLWTLLDYIV